MEEVNRLAALREDPEGGRGPVLTGGLGGLDDEGGGSLGAFDGNGQVGIAGVVVIIDVS